MAFYKDANNKQDRQQKRHDAEARGGFEDEGSQYSGAKRGPERGGSNRSGRGPSYGTPRAQGRDDRQQSGYRFAQGAPTRYNERGAGTSPRPYSEQRQDRRPDDSRPGRAPNAPRPYGDRNQPRKQDDNRADRSSFAPRNAGPAPRACGDRNQPRRQDDNRTERAPFAPRNVGPAPRAYGDRNQPRRQDDNRTERAPFAPRNAGPAPRPYGDRNQSRNQDDNRSDRAPFAPRNAGPAPRPYGDRNQPRRQDDNRAERSSFAPRNAPAPRPYGDRNQPRRQDDNRAERSSFAPRNAPAPRPYGDRTQPHRQDDARPFAEHNTPYRHDAPPAYHAMDGYETEDIVPAENLLSGRNPIREALKSGRDIEKLMVARGELSGSAREIVQMAKERHIPVQEVDRVRLDGITQNHQGMLAFASAYQYRTLEDMLELAKERNQAPFLVILDGITDPHNLGAIIRSAECAGAHGVIVQERRAVGLTPAAVKASAGAIEHLPVARVTNISSTLEKLKELNIWTFAADMDGEDYAKVDFSGALALVIGAEGEGVSRRVLDTCDKRVALPVRGQLDSLNASVAAGILLYTAMRAR